MRLAQHSRVVSSILRERHRLSGQETLALRNALGLRSDYVYAIGLYKLPSLYVLEGTLNTDIHRRER